MKKLLALILALAMAMSMLTVCAAAEDTDFGGITVTFMNSKPEITDAIKSTAKAWGDAHGVTFEVYETSNPNDTLTQKYQSGDAPVLAIVDTINVLDFAKEYMLPLDSEQWAEQTEMGSFVDGVLYGFPLTVESHCIVVNKTAVEANIGREFVAEEYKNIDTFAALLAEMRENGMEDPMVVLPDIWSMCGHDFYPFYAYQDGTGAGAFALVDAVKAGQDIAEDPLFAGHMKLMFDIIKEYNINKKDPLNADHDMSILELAEGNAAFLCNGSWTEAELKKFEATDDFVIMGYPNDGEHAGKVMAAPTKYITIDNTVATAEQQAAAKAFLNYLVFEEAGQKALIEDWGIVCAFTNNPFTPAGPVNCSLMQYIAEGKTVTYSPMTFPGDYRNTLTPTIQKLFANEDATVRQLADILNEYWRNTDPLGR